MAISQKDDTALAKVRTTGLMVLLGFGLFAVLTLFIGAAWVGYSGYHSESAGVTAMYWVTLPAGFSLFGLIGAIAGHFLVKRSVALKIAIPAVAGVVGAIGCFGLVFIFFNFIFPAL